MAAPVAVINGKYRLGTKLGSGGFGSVYAASDVNSETKEEIFAVKLEEIAIHEKDFLFHEERVYKRLGHCTGFVRIWWSGEVDKNYNALVMDRLGLNLAKCFSKCDHKFSIKTVSMLALQMIDRLQYLHDNDYIHRDLKPENFAMGLGDAKDINAKTVYLIDFGRARRFRNGSQNMHIKLSSDQWAAGTLGYTSLNAQLGQQMGRRDDLETLGNVLIYFAKGTLPWFAAINAKGEFDKEKMAKIKQRTGLKTLCEGLPIEFYTYMVYCRSLRFEQQPDYSYCRQIFEGLLISRGLCCDNKFDWMM